MTAGNDQPWWYQEPERPVDPDAARDEAFAAAAQEAIRLAAAVTDWADRSGLSTALRGIVDTTGTNVRQAAERFFDEQSSVAVVDPDSADISVTTSTIDRPTVTHGMDTSTIDAAARWLRESQQESADSTAEHSSTCEWCPVCQGVDALQVVSPELARGAAEALSAITASLRTAMESLATTAADRRPRTSEAARPADTFADVPIDLA